jgi:hypothetical protein
MNRLLTAALFSVSIVSAFAQDTSPPAPVNGLGWLVGAWTGSGDITFGDHSTAITTTMSVAFDGQFLRLASVDKSNASKLTKTSMIGWEAAKGQFICYTFTNASPAARIEHGKMEGNQLVFVSDPWEAEGMKLVGRETISKVSAGKFRLIEEAKMGGKWQKEMDFVLTKK